MLKNLIAVLFVSFISFQAIAQFPMGGRPGGGRSFGGNMNVGHFYGKLVDSKTNKPVGGATIQLKGNKFDTVTKKMKEVILKTIITEPNGDFDMDGLPIFGTFKFKATSIGYKALETSLSFGLKMPQGGGMPDAAAMQNMMNQVDKDLGNLKIEANADDLGNVTVVSTKPMFELGIDRKIFNVDKNIVSAGQTATEIMKNIPSLNVDIDGNVTFRNAAPTVFVDGRPTTLTLDQIPADIVDKVELISNPGAKYDASGGNAGILNVILKKNKKSGYNGGLRVGGDSRFRINTGGDFSIRQNKINVFATGNYFQRKSLSWNDTYRDNLFNPRSFISNKNYTENTGSIMFFRGGLDWFVDNRNTISFAANVNRGRFVNDLDQRIDSTISNVFTSYTNVLTNGDQNFRNFGAQLSYKHNFTKGGHNIGADINYNRSRNFGESNIASGFYKPDNSVKAPNFLQRSANQGNSNFFTGQIDYENPLGDDMKLEMGLRAAIRDFRNDNDQSIFNTATNSFIKVAAISNNFKFNDQVYAAYSSFSFKTKKWSFQLGLRLESSNYTGTLLSKTSGKDSLNFKVDFPISLFPSAFITRKLNDKEDLQLNYSRRVNRPNFFQLMPFPDYSDPQNINIGNPGLNPEFTHSLEVNYNNAYKKGANFLATVFFKQSNNLISRFVYRDKNAIIPGDSAFFSTFINANSGTSFGLELTNKIAITTWWDATVNLNIFNSIINDKALNLTNDLVSWFAKANNNFKLGKGWTFQLTGDYFGKTVLPQGSGGGGGRGGGGFGGGGGGMFMGGGLQTTAQGFILPRYSVDVALRKDFTWKKGRTASLSFSMNDIFRTQMFNTFSEQPLLFLQNSERRRDPQVLRINFSYRFGKFDTNLFKRKNNKADQSGGMDMMGG